ncbi:MAG: helix-turn-helix transcriptional regulator [Chloroflexi bacterium]|nr:helix-turn-helix transcriptional regulator [Chloroflexota bacterium]
MERVRARRRRVVVDNTALAQDIGRRLKAARLRAGLTQQKLAEGRYTKAYVSALEKGLAKPSMAALVFFSERLGLPPNAFLINEAGTWTRMEADLRLAAGEWQAAADAYTSLLESVTGRQARAELLVGLAEALCRLDQGERAIAPGAEALDTFEQLKEEERAAHATYWLSFAHYLRENREEARALLRGLLERVRGGLQVAPDFKVRVLTALAANETRDGEHGLAVSYLEEARGIAGDLDDRRRATFLMTLSISYRQRGDLEGAIRTANESLGLFRAAESDQEVASLEHELALTYLALGNESRAEELAASARRRFEDLGDERHLAHVADTEARIRLARGDARGALERVDEALRCAEATDNQKGTFDALLTRGRAQLMLDDKDAAAATYESATGLARDRGTPAQVREALDEWADTLAGMGEHERAYALTREALRAR